jgi:hypothetical protein
MEHGAAELLTWRHSVFADAPFCFNMGNRGSKVERVVERTITVVVNKHKDRYDRDQLLLEKVLNAGIARILAQTGETLMAIGPSGSSKSSTLNTFYGTTFVTGTTVADCTRELTQQTAAGRIVIDTVGFLPTYGNIGKMFLLFFIRGVFPDYLVIPASTGRLADVQALAPFIRSHLLKGVIFNFNANVYYALKGHVSDEHAKMTALGFTPAQIPAASGAGAAPSPETVPPHVADMQKYVENNGWEGAFVVYPGAGPIARPTGSMRDRFLAEFFVDGKYKVKSYDDHMKDLDAGRNQMEMLRGILVDAIGGVNGLRDNAIVHEGATGDITSIVSALHEVNFLKG